MRKAILRLPDLDHAKTAVLNSLTCPEAQRGYRHAIDEFVDWYCSEPRLAFNKTVVLRYVPLQCSGELVVDPLSDRFDQSVVASTRESDSAMGLNLVIARQLLRATAKVRSPR